MTIIAEKILM